MCPPSSIMFFFFLVVVSIELLFQVMRCHIKSDKCPAAVVIRGVQRHAYCCWPGRNGRRMSSIFIIDFFIEFSVSRSTPPSCRFLCPWHIVRVALSSHHPSRCSVLAPSVSCHVRLSSLSRRGSRVSKRSVNFPSWRLQAINKP